MFFKAKPVNTIIADKKITTFELVAIDNNRLY